ncbi:S26 family signal peptidase [Streptomyces sp. UNOC14_S4]|uniref:S26 family signal peptidase n=1 Tax=Streptomyces sp. UNOC14_S4 TaxID=2872340 RepID=UPI001E60A07F|nr:S26 family signal peptidase [Streptomyces sp. UNOC14_S4]
MLGSLAVGGLTAALVALTRGLVMVTVRGTSMWPAFQDGDRVLVRRGPHPSVGQVVVAERPVAGEWPGRPVRTEAGADAVRGREWLIKRVAAVAGDPVPRDRARSLARVPEDRVPPGKLVLLGDNRKVSFDSREVGYFPADRVLGRVLFGPVGGVRDARGPIGPAVP